MARERFGKVPTYIIQHANLSHAAKLVYTDLATYADKDDECFPKRSSVMRDLGMSRSTVIRALNELKEKGCIQNVGSAQKPRYHLGVSPMTPPGVTHDTPPEPLSMYSILTEPINRIAPMEPESDYERSIRLRQESSGLRRARKPEPEQSAQEIVTVDQQCESLWFAYPKLRRVGKPAAFKAMKVALKKEPFVELLAKVKRYAECKEDSEYVFGIVKFFKEEHYDDDPITWREANKKQQQEDEEYERYGY